MEGFMHDVLGETIFCDLAEAAERCRWRLERAARPDRERLDAIKVLHFWLNANQQVTHPVNQVLERVRERGLSDLVSADA